MKAKIHSVSSELDAAVVKGYLESVGIQASIAPSPRNPSGRYYPGPNVPYDIFVDEEKEEEAKHFLKERESR